MKKYLSSFNSHFSSRKGFTLIELLVVIAIIGILAAAVLVAINPGQRIASSRNATVRSDLNAIGNQANIFNTDTGLVSSCASGGSYANAFGQTVCTKVFMAAPKDPTGTPYVYKATPASCDGNTVGIACTAISVQGPAFSDGVIDASTNKLWCWRSATGTIVQTDVTGNCIP